jgi:uncharacterized membrane protein (UPF0182 family)
VGRVLPLAAALALVAVLVVLAWASGLVVDALWFREVDASIVFRTRVLAKLACFAVAFAATFGTVAAIGLFALRQVQGVGVVRVVFRDVGNGQASLPELIAPYAERLPWRWLVLGAAAVAGTMVGLAQASNWETYWLWRYGGPFGVADPYFARDVGFFIFTLPAWRALAGAAMAIVVFAAIVSAGIFWLRGAVDLRRPDALTSPAVMGMTSLVLALYLLVKAAGYWLGRYELLLEPYGAVFGAGYSDSHV